MKLDEETYLIIDRVNPKSANFEKGLLGFGLPIYKWFKKIGQINVERVKQGRGYSFVIDIEYRGLKHTEYFNNLYDVVKFLENYK